MLFMAASETEEYSPAQPRETLVMPFGPSIQSAMKHKENQVKA
jgi:hypothetical protein